MRTSTNYHIKLNESNQMIDIIGSDETADYITIIKMMDQQRRMSRGLYRLIVHQIDDNRLFRFIPSYVFILKRANRFWKSLIIPNFNLDKILCRHDTYFAVDFAYSLQFHQSNDTPYPYRTRLYEKIKMLANEGIPEDKSAVVDTLSNGNYAITVIRKQLFDELYSVFIHYNIIDLSKQFIYNVLGIHDFMEDVREEFDFILTLYGTSDVEKVTDIIGKWQISQDGINTAFERFFDLDIPDEFDSNQDDPVLDFSIFKKKFHILRMPKLPMYGYMLSKKIIQKYFEEEKNRIAFDFPKVEIEVYSRKDMSEIDCFAFSGKDSRGWSTFDILEVIPTVLDLLALKYKASVKCTLSFTGSKKLIVTDQYSALHERENLFFRYLNLLK